MNRFSALITIIFIGLISFFLLKIPITTYAQTTSIQQKGDANSDGKVDGLDYVVWLTYYNQTITGPTKGDFNNNGKTDGQDYVIWLQNYGTSLSSHSQLQNYFPYGIFEDGNMWHGSASRSTMQADINTLKANNLDDILFTNRTPNIDIIDSNNIKVIAAPMDELYPKWWSNTTVTESISAALNIAQPIVDGLKNHSNIIAYNLADDAAAFSTNKLSLMTQAFNTADPNRPALIMNPGSEKFLASPAPIYLGYLYPAKTTNAQCDFNSKGIMGRYVNNFSQALELERDTLLLQEKNIPHWFVLQAHGISPNVDPNTANVNSLRTPSVPEMRLQNWIAISQGIRGIYWFIYRTQQFWIGLKDNQPLFNEVSDLARRVNAVSPTLLTLKNYDQQLFTGSTTPTLPLPNQPIVTTLTNSAQNQWYIVVVNHSCIDQNITVTSQFTSGQLKDLETGTTYTLGQQISFRAGDGKLFQILGTVNKPSTPITTNVIKNPSFENGSANPLDWPTRSGWSRDASVAHTGQASLKITGPLSSSYSVVPMNGALKPYTKYTLSFWVKTSNVTNQGVSMRYVHLSPSIGLSLPPLTTSSGNGTSDWKQISKEFYTFADLTQSRVDLQFDLTNGGTAWVDDIVLCEGKLGCGNPALSTISPTLISATSTIRPITSTPLPSSTPIPSSNPFAGGIPHIKPDFTQDVEDWWQTHPFNPDNSQSIPVGEISSPSLTINVKQQYNGNIKAAIDALPASGGTLFFEPGEYENTISMIGRTNVHFVSNGDAIIKGPLNGEIFLYSATHPSTAVQTIAGCQSAVNYDAFITYLSNTNSTNHTAAVNCLKDLKGNIYFKNLIFDGGGTAYTALRFAAMGDVVFDNVTFQNYLDSKAGHPGIISGHEGVDNIWFRNCSFRGPNRFAVYLDGLHGGGIINSRIEGYFGSGSLLFLTNDDYTFDLNANGIFESSEKRIGNYIVVQGNQFSGGVQTIAATTANTLVQNNLVNSFVSQFVNFDVRNSNHGATYNFYGNKIIENRTQDVLTFFDIDGPAGCTTNQVCARSGKYTIKNNTIQNTSRFQTLIKESNGQVDGPNIVTNNCINGICN